MDTFFQEEVKEQKKNEGAWAKMNFIQRSGCIGCGVSFVPTFCCSGRMGVYFGVAGWSVLLFGYVAGALWKVRHAVHFWWSLIFAGFVHAALLPMYVFLVDQMKNAPGHGGKAFIYLAGGAVSVETIILVFVLKRVAMWLHHRHSKTFYSSELNR